MLTAHRSLFSICGSGLVFSFILVAYLPIAAWVTGIEGAATVMHCLSSWLQSCASGLPIANYVLTYSSSIPLVMRWWEAWHLLASLRATFGLLTLSLFWLQHNTCHLRLSYPFPLECERKGWCCFAKTWARAKLLSMRVMQCCDTMRSYYSWSISATWWMMRLHLELYQPRWWYGTSCVWLGIEEIYLVTLSSGVTGL